MRAPRGFVWTYPAMADLVTDGDSFHAHVMVKPETEEHDVNVRLDGINAIELNQQFGAEARDRLKALLPAGTQILLLCRKREKYGRLLARVIRDDGSDVCNEMLMSKASDGITSLAIPYDP